MTLVLPARLQPSVWGMVTSTAAQYGVAGRKPLLLVGGDGEKRTLPAAAAHGDMVNWQVGISEFTRKNRVLDQLCEASGRDPTSLGRTHAPNFQLFESQRDFRRWCQDEQRGMSASEIEAYVRDRGALYGRASAIGATLEEFIDAGCSGFMIFCNGSPALDSLEQLASLRLNVSSGPGPDPGSHGRD
jgi:alkanesulfonate monooxygenase SsuD/methylene tetrahydromethanopterin reductase-like flavin-dependent oxidoreductase (luciferase family)